MKTSSDDLLEIAFQKWLAEARLLGNWAWIGPMSLIPDRDLRVIFQAGYAAAVDGYSDAIFQ